MKNVLNRVAHKGEALSASFIRTLRKTEREARICGQADYRLHLPYDADSINRLFYYLPSVKGSELKSLGTEPVTAQVPAPDLEAEVSE